MNSHDRIIIFTTRGKLVNGVYTTIKRKKAKKLVILRN